MSFDLLNLNPHIRENIRKLGFEIPTPIQRKAIPAVLEGRDVIGLAQTGTGKTAAFLVVVLQRLLVSQGPAHEHGRSHPRALIVAPTRELAVQIHKDTLLLAKHTGLRSTVVYGGTG